MATTALGYRQITGLSSVKTLADGVGIVATNTGIPSGAHYAVIQCDDQNVRWTDDGSTPTATKGMVITAGDALTYDLSLSTLKFIEETASAVLNITYYGSP